MGKGLFAVVVVVVKFLGRPWRLGVVFVRGSVRGDFLKTAVQHHHSLIHYFPIQIFLYFFICLAVLP